MNGADRLCDVLLVNGVDVCFANPGTSEMHFVAALDRRPEMRCVLGLFEGVASGAADGYARMTGRPAATLLHTGPGLANALANLHNARRARSPIVNVVGDHASYHLACDAPLTSDIESLAQPMSLYVRRADRAEDVGLGAEETYRAAVERRGPSTLILPADAAWGEVAPDARHWARPAAAPNAEAATIRRAIEAARSAPGRVGLVLAGEGARGEGLHTAGRIAAATGARLFCEVLTPRVERGRGRVPVQRIPYPIDLAIETLKDIDVLLLVGAQEPVAFFGYPGKPSRLVSDRCRVIPLVGAEGDIPDALQRLADGLGVTGAEPTPMRPRTAADYSLPTGPLTDEAISAITARMLPEQAIVVDEGLTSARSLYALAEGAPPHDYMLIAGGAIGAGIPLAIGAAIACPGRKVVALQADGSGMYTIQGLWTQAREALDVVTIIFSNRAYAILRLEMTNVGVRQFGRNAERMLRLDEPALDWVQLAGGMGVEAGRATTAEEFATLLSAALARPGPFLIEAVI